jgi:hypothetical protein
MTNERFGMEHDAAAVVVVVVVMVMSRVSHQDVRDKIDSQ